MKRRHARWAQLKVLGLPALALAVRIAAAALAIAMFAGTVRVLPILLAASVPVGLAWPLGRGVVLVGLELASFVAPPLAFAIATAALVERGEARALSALGTRPLRILLGASPCALALALVAGLAAHTWGRDATAPGRLARSLLSHARTACVEERAPTASHVPLLGLTWVCLANEPPRVVGSLPIAGASGAATLAAAAIALSDDLRTLEVVDAEVLLRRRATEGAPTRVAALGLRSARVLGLPTVGPASNLTPFARALLLGGTAFALSALGTLLLLVRSIASRLAAAVASTTGTAAALTLFSALERAPHSMLAYAAVPALGSAALVLASLPWWRANGR